MLDASEGILRMKHCMPYINDQSKHGITNEISKPEAEAAEESEQKNKENTMDGLTALDNALDYTENELESAIQHANEVSEFCGGEYKPIEDLIPKLEQIKADLASCLSDELTRVIDEQRKLDDENDSYQDRVH